MSKLTHINEDGYAKMVDVSSKNSTKRIAIAVGEIHMQPETINLITDKNIEKGDVLAVAQVSGILATKKTDSLIPMCHSIPIEGVDIKFEVFETFIKCTCEVKCSGKTGVEMEAIVGVTMALTTIYDMCKAVDKYMKITNVYLQEKIGGKSGHFIYKDKF